MGERTENEVFTATLRRRSDAPRNTASFRTVVIDGRAIGQVFNGGRRGGRWTADGFHLIDDGERVSRSGFSTRREAVVWLAGEYGYELNPRFRHEVR